MVRRKQQIGQVELLGAVAPYMSLPDLLRGRDVVHFVVNTSAVAALTKGYSRVPDSARIVHAFHVRGVQARVRMSGSSMWCPKRTLLTSPHVCSASQTRFSFPLPASSRRRCRLCAQSWRCYPTQRGGCGLG